MAGAQETVANLGHAIWPIHLVWAHRLTDTRFVLVTTSPVSRDQGPNPIEMSKLVHLVVFRFPGSPSPFQTRA